MPNSYKWGLYPTEPTTQEDIDKFLEQRETDLVAGSIEAARVEVSKDVATKADGGKTNWSLMPFEAIEEINKVLEFGALKYDGWNFAKGEGMKWSRIANSLLRHMFAWMRGEDNDPESGLSHLSHIGCNVIFLIYYKMYPQFIHDDRYKRAIGIK